jgi:hypothetical protein
MLDHRMQQCLGIKMFHVVCILLHHLPDQFWALFDISSPTGSMAKYQAWLLNNETACITPNLDCLSLKQICNEGFWSSGMLYCVAGNSTYPKVLKEHEAFNFKGWLVLDSSWTYQPLKMKVLCFFKMFRYYSIQSETTHNAITPNINVVKTSNPAKCMLVTTEPSLSNLPNHGLLSRHGVHKIYFLCFVACNNNWFKKRNEQCANIELLTKTKKTASKTFTLLHGAYGDSALSKAHVAEECRQVFRKGKVRYHKKPGRPLIIKTHEKWKR